MGTYGLTLDGPLGHLWYKVLDKYVEPDNPRGNKAVLLKTAADQIIWAPVMTCVFFAVLKSLEGHPELIWPTIQDKLIKTVAVSSKDHATISKLQTVFILLVTSIDGLIRL